MGEQSLRVDTSANDRTVEVPVGAAEEALFEFDRLIKETEGDGSDPLTDRTFRARDAFKSALGRIGSERASDERSVLEEAADVIGSRGDTHGDVRENHEQIAAFWSAFLGVDVEAHEVAEMMVLLKISRCSAGGPARDHYVDVCGYAEIAAALGLDGGGDDAE